MRARILSIFSHPSIFLKNQRNGEKYTKYQNTKLKLIIRKIHYFILNNVRQSLKILQYGLNLNLQANFLAESLEKYSSNTHASVALTKHFSEEILLSKTLSYNLQIKELCLLGYKTI